MDQLSASIDTKPISADYVRMQHVKLLHASPPMKDMSLRR